MSQSKTDKIRERLKEADEYDKHLAIEAVVEECEPERVTYVSAEFIVDIIANELDVDKS